MKVFIVTVALLAGSWFSAFAQASETAGAIQQISDKLALKELVDVFSNLADTKDVVTQVQLFTEDATVNSYRDGKLVSSLKGRQELAERFGAFLALFEVVYHMNGQQVVEIDGDKATGVCYCQVVLIRTENGKKTMSTQGVRYKDEYVRINGKWLISKRTSDFVWTDNRTLNE